MSHACQQLRLSIFSLRNNIKSSQLKIKCDDVLVLAKFLLSTAFLTAMSSAGEARLTDKILKGFFFKTSLFHSRVPPFYPYVSFSLSQSAHVHLLSLARARKADQGFFALRKDSKSLSLSLSLSLYFNFNGHILSPFVIT